MTIRTMLYGVLGLMGTMLAALAINDGYQAWMRWGDAVRTRQVNAATDTLLAAAHEVIAERDSMELAMGRGGHADHGAGSPAVAGGTGATGGDHGMSHGRGTFGRAMQQLHALQNYEGRQDLMDAAHASKDALDALKARMSSGSQGEMGELMAAWPEASNRLLLQIEEIRLASARTGAGRSAVAGTFPMLKHFSYVIADFASRERVAMALLIADDFPIPPNRLPELYSWRGRVELAWQALEEAAASGVGGEPVVAAVARARKAFFEEFESMRRQVFQSGLSGQSYPVGEDEWLQASEHAIAAVRDLEQAIIAAGMRDTEAAAGAALNNMLTLAAVLAFAALVLILSAVAVARRVVEPVKGMTRAMASLASGNVNVEIPAARRNDEIGEMARAVHVFRDNAIEKARLEDEQEAADRRAREEKRKGMLETADRFERQVREVGHGVSSAANEMQATAQQMSSTAEESSRQSSNVAVASEQASANVQTVATAAEEMSASIAEIGRQAGQSAKIAAQAVDDARKTNTAVRGLDAAAQ